MLGAFRAFRAICAQNMPDDGVVFDLDTRTPHFVERPETAVLHRCCTARFDPRLAAFNRLWASDRRVL
jgi:hypothetical protein